MDIDAFILIGGRSERFGSDKAFFEFEGETLAGRAARIVDATLSPSRLTFVTSTDDQFAAGLLFTLGRPVIADLKPGFGAWSGLHTALAYALAEWAFVLACDLPFVTADGLRVLTSKTAAEVDAVIPRQEDERLQPLCAMYRTAAVRPVVEEILSGDRHLPALASIGELIRTSIVEADELASSRNFFHNVNTLNDVTK
jgi:molybdopterin-guanine dinucleotide biosynthesis protein A